MSYLVETWSVMKYVSKAFWQNFEKNSSRVQLREPWERRPKSKSKLLKTSIFILRMSSTFLASVSFD